MDLHNQVGQGSQRAVQTSKQVPREHLRILKIAREHAVPIHIAVSMVFRESVTAMCFCVPPLPTCPAAPQTILFRYRSKRKPRGV
jgi:hypothetical protein